MKTGKIFKLSVILFLSLFFVISKKVHAEKLNDGAWEQTGAPGTTYISFTNGATRLYSGYQITLTFPDIVAVNPSSVSAQIEGETNPMRTNSTNANQIYLSLRSTIEPYQEINITMTNALSSINRGLTVGDSVGINTFDTTQTSIDESLAYLVVQGTTVRAGVPSDIDEDGIPSWWELQYGFDPIDPSNAQLDADNDGLTNLQEYIYGTNPLAKDTDGDDIDDYDEIFKYGTNPLKDYVPDDLDDDGLPNWWEIQYGLDYENDGDDNDDPDKDGLTNLREYLAGTNPQNPDTDNDGLSDFDEVTKYLTNPLEADTDQDGLTDESEIFTHFTNPVALDTDFDGLGDYEEIFVHGTNPNIWDTDDGGMSDRDEVENGSDPLFKDDDYGFVWNMYYGYSPNDMFKMLENVKITIFQGIDLSFEAALNSDIQSISVKYNEKGFSSEKEFIKLKLLSPSDPGLYDVEVILLLKSGKLIKMHRYVEVRQRGQVIRTAEGQFNGLYNKLDMFDKEPVENAKIEAYVFNEFTKEMELFRTEYFDRTNPQYTDSKGTYVLALHPGNYLIKISKPGIGTKEILYNTDQYSLYSEDIIMSYNYDAMIWGGIFTGVFILVWNTISTIQYIRYVINERIEKRARRHHAY